MFSFNSGRCLPIFFLFVVSFNSLLSSSFPRFLPRRLKTRSLPIKLVAKVLTLPESIIQAMVEKPIAEPWRPIKIESTDVALDFDSMKVKLSGGYIEKVLLHCVDFQAMRTDVDKVRKYFQYAIRYGISVSAGRLEIADRYGVQEIGDIESRYAFQGFFWYATGSRTQTIIRLSVLGFAAYGFGRAIYQISSKIAAKVRHKREKPQ